MPPVESSALRQVPPTSPELDFSVLRILRKQEGLTLEETCRRSGVSTAVISKLERNQSAAELGTLYRLARVFGMSASELLALAEARLATTAEAVSYAHDGFSFDRVTYRNASAFYARARAKARISRPELHHDDYEVCWVLEGELEITLPSETRRLRAGRSLQFDAMLPHSYASLADTRFIILHLRKENRF